MKMKPVRRDHDRQCHLPDVGDDDRSAWDLESLIHVVLCGAASKACRHRSVSRRRLLARTSRDTESRTERKCWVPAHGLFDDCVDVRKMTAIANSRQPIRPDDAIDLLLSELELLWVERHRHDACDHGRVGLSEAGQGCVFRATTS